jgi:hypothetical protein
MIDAHKLVPFRECIANFYKQKLRQGVHVHLRASCYWSVLRMALGIIWVHLHIAGQVVYRISQGRSQEIIKGG